MKKGFVKIGEVQRTHIVFYIKMRLLPLTFSDDGGNERPELERSKVALLVFPVCQNLEFHLLHKVRCKWVFFQQSGCWAI